MSEVEFGGVADVGADVVAGVERLSDDFAADAAGGAEGGEIHRPAPTMARTGMESSWVRMRLGDGDCQLAARAGGEGRERLADPVQRVGLLDRRLQAAGRNLGGEAFECGGVRIREYTRDA